MKKDIGKYIFLCSLILTGVMTCLVRTIIQKESTDTKHIVVEQGTPNKKMDKPLQQDVQKPQTQLPEAETQEQVQDHKIFQKMPDEYLEGSLFIGDSRTSTLATYSGWKTCSFWVKNGISIWEVMDERIASVDGSKNLSVRDGLLRKQFSKIYIMLGINELGTGTPESFYSQYESVILEIRKLQPDAKIFVQGILHVTDGKDQDGSYINNKEIDLRNRLLSKIDGIECVYYLDLNAVFDEPEKNKLDPAYSTDGVHLKANQIDKWKQFLLEHGVKQ